MNNRPTSLTIIAWLMIIGAAFGLYGALTLASNPMAAEMMRSSPLPLAFHQAIGVIGAIISLICGYGVLKGFNWARLLYVGWSIGGFVLSLVTIPIPSILIMSAVFFAVIVFFLFRPAANAWFNANGHASGGAREADRARPD